MQNDFDIAAPLYDETFTNTSIGKAQRMQVYQQLNTSSIQDKSLQILELNCGTGEDANYFNSLNHNVTATDISNEMIAVALEKFKDKDINFHQLDINKLSDFNPKEKFDLIFSNFGGFNCLSKTEIESFFTTARSIISKQGKIVLVIMPKQTVWERLYFLFKGDLKKANRRNFNKAINANVNGIVVKTWYFNPKDILKAFFMYSSNRLKVKFRKNPL